MIASPVIKAGGYFPNDYTCQGRNISPPLIFTGIPDNAESIALWLEDSDARPVSWIHWFVFNIPPVTAAVKEGVIPQGGTEGLANGNSFGYEGPCQKYFKGIHHYVFTAVALRKMLGIPKESTYRTAEYYIKRLLIEKASLTGLCRGMQDERDFLWGS